MTYLPGDANLDGFVDGSDFNIWNANKFQATGGWSRGDFNVDRVIDGSDFNIWNSYKFQSADLRPRRRSGSDLAPPVDTVFAAYADDRIRRHEPLLGTLARHRTRRAY